MYLMVKVIPNAPKNQIVGKTDGVVKIKIKAPPEDGKANEALILFLSETLNVPKKKIRIVSGETSRTKKIEIEGDVTLPL